MPRFRKRPVVVDAEQTAVRVEIETLEGTMTAEPGDWIITGIQRERYPCKPEIFEQTYEAEDAPPMGLRMFFGEGAELLSLETVQRPDGGTWVLRVDVTGERCLLKPTEAARLLVVLEWLLRSGKGAAFHSVRKMMGLIGPESLGIAPASPLPADRDG